MLNGCDLSQFGDESFDMVATYSVLHHVPNYLNIVSEFIRVLKPGGIVYIDHEVCPSYWEKNIDYEAYCREILDSQPIQPKNYVKKIINALCRKNMWRYLSSSLKVKWNSITDEGDIHVHADDHIEWPKIESIIGRFCNVVCVEDYLVCREQTFPAPVWVKWRSRCADMRLIIAVKR